MKFYPAFFSMLLWRPHRALGALYWYLTKRRVRARNRLRLVSAQAPHAYQVWINVIERHDEAVDGATATIAGWAQAPRFTIVVPFLRADERGALLATLAGVERQCFGGWRVIVVRGHDAPTLPGFRDARMEIAARTAGDAAEALDIGIGAATREYVVPLPSGTILSPTALFRYAGAALAGDRPAIMFGDHDELDRRGGVRDRGSSRNGTPRCSWRRTISLPPARSAPISRAPPIRSIECAPALRSMHCCWR